MVGRIAVSGLLNQILIMLAVLRRNVRRVHLRDLAPKKRHSGGR